MQPYSERMTSVELSKLVIRCFPGLDEQKSSFELYEDDGISLDYNDNKKALTKLSYERKKNTHTLIIHPTIGAYEGQLNERSYQIELGAIKQIKSVTVDGKKVKAIFNDEKKVYEISISSRDIRAQLIIRYQSSE